MSPGLPAFGSEACVFHGDPKGGIVLFSLPCCVVAMGSAVGGSSPIRPVYVVPACCCCVSYLFERHVFSPLASRGNGEKVSHTALVYQEKSAGAGAYESGPLSASCHCSLALPPSAVPTTHPGRGHQTTLAWRGLLQGAADKPHC